MNLNAFVLSNKQHFFFKIQTIQNLFLNSLVIFLQARKKGCVQNQMPSRIGIVNK